jgi:hypothetical protein
VPFAADASARVKLPGGVPFVVHLPDTATSMKLGLPRWQREAMIFAPGETAHQSFRRDLFDGLCAGCHGSVSGRPVDAAVRPDILTEASSTLARDALPTDLNLPPDKRGATSGPPARP